MSGLPIGQSPSSPEPSKGDRGGGFVAGSARCPGCGCKVRFDAVGIPHRKLVKNKNGTFTERHVQVPRVEIRAWLLTSPEARAANERAMEAVREATCPGRPVEGA